MGMGERCGDGLVAYQAYGTRVIDRRDTHRVYGIENTHPRTIGLRSQDISVISLLGEITQESHGQSWFQHVNFMAPFSKLIRYDSG
jgi:hypothetical protein